MSDVPKEYSVIVHERAARMLYSHIRFVADVSVPAARKLKTALESAMASLRSMPFRCPAYRTRKTPVLYRQLIVGRYQIVFDIDENASTVNIRYILDTREENDYD